MGRVWHLKLTTTKYLDLLSPKHSETVFQAFSGTIQCCCAHPPDAHSCVSKSWTDVMVSTQLRTTVPHTLNSVTLSATPLFVNRKQGSSVFLT